MLPRSIVIYALILLLVLYFAGFVAYRLYNLAGHKDRRRLRREAAQDALSASKREDTAN